MAAEREIVFEEGLLGVTLKRSTMGRAVVKEVNAETQAGSNGIALNDVVRFVGGTDLRSVALEKASWATLIETLRTLPRPLTMVVSAGAPEEIIEKSKKAAPATAPSSTTNVGMDSAAQASTVSMAESAPPASSVEETPQAVPPQADTVASNAPEAVSNPMTNTTEVSESATLATTSTPVPAFTPALAVPVIAAAPPAADLGTVADLAAWLEWPTKGKEAEALKKARQYLLADGRGQEPVRKAGAARAWAQRGWFGGNALQPRQLFLSRDVLLICATGDDENNGHSGRPNSSAGAASLASGGRRWLVESVVELRVCKLRDAPSSPLAGVAEDDEACCFEILGGGADAQASSSSGGGSPPGALALAANSAEARHAWCEAIFAAVAECCLERLPSPPPRGWYHGLRQGNLLACAHAGDVQGLAAALGKESSNGDSSSGSSDGKKRGSSWRPAANGKARGRMGSSGDPSSSGDDALLIAGCLDVNECDLGGDSALHLCLRSLAGRALGLDGQNDDNNSNSRGGDSRHSACAEAVQALVASGVNAVAPDASGRLPVHVAAERLDAATLSMLLPAPGAASSVNTPDPTRCGRPPHYQACLIAASLSRSLRHKALQAQRFPIANTSSSSSSGNRISSQGSDSSSSAAARREASTRAIAQSAGPASSVLLALTRCLACLSTWGADLNATDDEGLSVVHRLALGLHFDVLEIVLLAGADADLPTPKLGLPYTGPQLAGDAAALTTTTTTTAASTTAAPSPASPRPASSAASQAPGSPSASGAGAGTRPPVGSPPGSPVKLSNADVARLPQCSALQLTCAAHLVPAKLASGAAAALAPPPPPPPTTTSAEPTATSSFPSSHSEAAPGPSSSSLRVSTATGDGVAEAELNAKRSLADGTISLEEYQVIMKQNKALLAEASVGTDHSPNSSADSPPVPANASEYAASSSYPRAAAPPAPTPSSSPLSPPALAPPPPLPPPQAALEFKPAPNFALPETLRVLLNHAPPTPPSAAAAASGDRAGTRRQRTHRATSGSCGLTPLQLLLRGRGVSSPPVAASALLLLAGGAKYLDGPDPEGHWLGVHLADGLAQQLGAGVPFEWHGSDGADGVGAGSTVVPGTRHVAGALLLVTRGRFGFLGGSDKERQVMCLALAHAKGALSPLHWLAPAPDEAKSSSRSGGSSSSMSVSSGEERAQPGFLALRVKKDELRTAVVAVSANAFASSNSSRGSSATSGEAANACLLSLDAESVEVPKRGSGLVSAGSSDRPAAFPLTLNQAARVEGEESKAASLLALRPSERKAWASALRAAFPALFTNGNSSSGSSSSRDGGPSSDKAELFGSNSGSGATPASASSASAAQAGATGAEDAANEAMKGLQERGEKLSQLAEKTQMLEDSASEFEKMCKDLEKQQRGRWF